MVCQALCKLAYRHLPLFEVVDFPVPYEKPSDDEISVAQRIFNQVKQNLVESEVNTTSTSITNDFLSQIAP